MHTLIIASVCVITYLFFADIKVFKSVNIRKSIFLFDLDFSYLLEGIQNTISFLKFSIFNIYLFKINKKFKTIINI